MTFTQWLTSDRNRRRDDPVGDLANDWVDSTRRGRGPQSEPETLEDIKLYLQGQNGRAAIPAAVQAWKGYRDARRRQTQKSPPGREGL